MADVRDYLEMRADVLLGERPFNDVDNVILASLSYLDLRGIADASGLARLSVRKACEAFLARAAAAGCRTENGFGMLKAQAREQRRIWGITGR